MFRAQPLWNVNFRKRGGGFELSREPVARRWNALMRRSAVANQRAPARRAVTPLGGVACGRFGWHAPIGYGWGRVMDIGPDRRGRRDRAADAQVVPFQHFFATAAVPCPYVPGRDERKLIVELTGHAAASFFDELSRAGCRRSH